MNQHLSPAQLDRQQVRDHTSGRYAATMRRETGLSIPAASVTEAQLVPSAGAAISSNPDRFRDGFGLGENPSVVRTWRMPNGRFRSAEIVSQTVACFEGDGIDWAAGGSRTWEGIDVEIGLVEPVVREQLAARGSELRELGPAGSPDQREPKLVYQVSETYVLSEYDRHPGDADAVRVRGCEADGDLFGSFDSLEEAEEAAWDNTRNATFYHLVPSTVTEEWFTDDDDADVGGVVEPGAGLSAGGTCAS